jgi:hypothetical protein
MATPKYTISKDVDVGIYNGTYVARVYNDKIIVVTPTVRWVENTGTYHEVKEAIRDPDVIRMVLEDLADDCEDDAWRHIGDDLQDGYLSQN